MNEDLVYCQRQIQKLFDTYPGLTNQKLGDIAGVTKTSVSQWRNGHKRISPYSQGRIIAKFKLPKDYFQRPMSDDEIVQKNVRIFFSKLDPEELALFDLLPTSKFKELTFNNQPGDLKKKLLNEYYKDAKDTENIDWDKVGFCGISVTSTNKLDEDLEFATLAMEGVAEAVIFLSKIDKDFKSKYPAFFSDSSSDDFSLFDVVKAIDLLNIFVYAVEKLWPEVESTYFLKEKEISAMSKYNGANQISSRYSAYDFSLQCTFNRSGSLDFNILEDSRRHEKPILEK